MKEYIQDLSCFWSYEFIDIAKFKLAGLFASLLMTIFVTITYLICLFISPFTRA